MADTKLVERNIPGMNNRATRFAEVQHAENAADTLRRVSSYFSREKKLVAGMLAAVVLGTACMVDGLIERYRAELGDVPTIVACGGLSPSIVPHCRTNIILDQDLLLDGLLAIYRRNTPPKQH